MNHSLSHKLFLILSLALLLTLSSTPVWAQGNGPAALQQGSPPVISYQGRVTVNGQPFDGTGYFKFAIVDSQGQLTWTSDIIVQSQSPRQLSPPTQPLSIAVSQGLFSVLLGNPLSMNTLSPLAFSDSQTSLRLWFSSDAVNFTQLPDRPLAAVPYAMVSDTLDGYDSSDFAGIDHNHWSESWNGSGNGLELQSSDGYGLYGIRGVKSGKLTFGAGVIGDSAESTGVVGFSNKAAGVVGFSTDDAGVGGISEKGNGIWGSSTNAAGVYGSAPVTGTVGVANNTSGPTRGIYGESASDNGVGVYGLANAGGGSTVGVYGKAPSLNGKGVHGEGGFYGVYGVGTDPSGISYGVYGETGSTYNGSSGINGVARATSGVTYGVIGQSNSPDGYGVYSLGNMHVNGKLSWSALTRTFSLPAAAFVPGRSGIQYENTHLLRNMDGGICNSQKPFMSPVNLPDSATITALREFVYNRNAGSWTDADSTCATAEVRFIRINLLDGSFDILMSVEMSGSVPQGSYRNFLTTTISPAAAAVVDNTHYSYFVTALLPGTGAELNLLATTIDYQITQP